MNQEKGSTNNRGNFPCSKCRKMLPAGTAVCPYCMEAQDTAKEVVIPGSRKKIWIGAGLVLAAVMIALIAFLSPKKPKVYDNGTDTVQYKDYKLILSANNYESDPYSHLEIFCTRGDNYGHG